MTCTCGTEMEREDCYEIDGEYCIPAATYCCPDCGKAFIWVLRRHPFSRRMGVIVMLHDPWSKEEE